MGNRSMASSTKFQTSMVGSNKRVPNMTFVDSKCSPISYCAANEKEAREIGKAAINTAARPLLPFKSTINASPTITNGTRTSLRDMQNIAWLGEIRRIRSCRCIQQPMATRETGDTQSPSHPNNSHAQPNPVTYLVELGLKYFGPILVSERKNPMAIAHRTGLWSSAFPTLVQICCWANNLVYEGADAGVGSASIGRTTSSSEASSSWLVAFLVSFPLSSWFSLDGPCLMSTRSFRFPIKWHSSKLNWKGSWKMKDDIAANWWDKNTFSIDRRKINQTTPSTFVTNTYQSIKLSKLLTSKHSHRYWYANYYRWNPGQAQPPNGNMTDSLVCPRLVPSRRQE